MTDKLYFNGINGTTGAYGLEPMTAQAFANHVLDEWYAELREVGALKASLEGRVANDRKILEIVEQLVSMLVDQWDAQAPGSRAWSETLASRILSVVIDGGGPPDVSASIGDVRTLAQHLDRSPVETVRRLVRLLQQNQGAELAQWLLNVDEGRDIGLRGSLEARFDQALVGLRRAFLDDEATQGVDERGQLRSSWVVAFTGALEQLPLDAIRVVQDIDPASRALATLVSGLQSEAIFGDGAPASLDTQLAILANLGHDTPWRGMVGSLRDLLVAVSEHPAPVRWPALRDQLQAWLDELRRLSVGRLGVVPWVDPLKLAEAGWGIIFPAAMPEARRTAIETALAPLLTLRRQQAGDLFQIFAEGGGYRPGDTADLFLRRPPRGADVASPADPAATGVPYYLLLVGDPEEIPFTFQYQLDVQYAVGRLDFGDRWQDYECYARNVVAAEAPSFTHHPQAVFIGTRHLGDEATTLSSEHLVTPLFEHAKARSSGKGWWISNVAPVHATKAQLIRLLQLDRPPALLFAAAHGLEFDAEDAHQRDRQGALLCQDWDGVEGEVSPEVYLAAHDIDAGMNLQGMIVFIFACYGAGTPRYDDYYRREFKKQGKVIAERPFIAALPQAMLALRDRGALAVVGHVERAWSLSFLSDLANRPEDMAQRNVEHVQAFDAAIDRLLAGHPVGAALDFLDMRYAAIATELAALYDKIGDPPRQDEVYRLAELWTAHNDARGYIVLGDPAVRLKPPTT